MYCANAYKICKKTFKMNQVMNYTFGSTLREICSNCSVPLAGTCFKWGEKVHFKKPEKGILR